jgi:hypothetical protein
MEMLDLNFDLAAKVAHDAIAHAKTVARHDFNGDVTARNAFRAREMARWRDEWSFGTDYTDVPPETIDMASAVFTTAFSDCLNALDSGGSFRLDLVCRGGETVSICSDQVRGERSLTMPKAS